MQDVAREDGRQQGHPRQQHHDQVQRNGAQDDLGLPHIGQAFLDLLDRTQLARIDLGLAAGADQQQGADGQEEQTHGAGIGQGHVQPDDDPAEGRAGDGPGLEGDGLGRDSRRQGLAPHHHGQEGLAGRGQEGARRAEHGGHGQQPPQRRRPVQGHGEKGQGAQALDHDGQGHGVLAVAPVGHGPGGQGEGQQRQELTQAHQPQIEAGFGDRMIAPGDLIDLPQQGRGLNLDAQDSGDASDPQQAEIADRPGTGRPAVVRSGRGRRLGRNGRGGVDTVCGHVLRGVFG
ncbi:hypothetical protein D3C71_312510 [compost metagenome]